MTFQGIEGKARYHGTPVEEALPVIIESGDDRCEAPQGVKPHVVFANHPIVAGLPRSWPRLLGYNRFSPKPRSSIVAQVGEDPLIVAGAFGKGRSVAFASDCGPHWAPPEFVDWEGYAPSVAPDRGLGGARSMIAPLNVMRWGDRGTENRGRAARDHRQRRRLRPPCPVDGGARMAGSAPDLRGHGESPRGDGDFSTAALLQDLAHAAPTAPDLLIGHSFGGYLAQTAFCRGCSGRARLRWRIQFRISPTNKRRPRCSPGMKPISRAPSTG